MDRSNKTLRIGIDLGSTTAKVVAVSEQGEKLFARYQRHNMKTTETVSKLLRDLYEKVGDATVAVRLTGSVGMGMSERTGIDFVQEVVAATNAIRAAYPEARTMIDIGGEDAKMVFFKSSGPADLRMNGNCAGGTGAFIDQMAVILGVSVDEMGSLALKSSHTYPIASRCGVFCKTDIQNLIAKNASREDIARSIFHAVAVQTVTTLSRGCDIERPVLFCGGPLTFLPALRLAFEEYLQLDGNTDAIYPEHGETLTATGAALMADKDGKSYSLKQLIEKIESSGHSDRKGLAPIFTCRKEYEQWKERISRNVVKVAPMRTGYQEAYLGIDSGSTTTKIVATDGDGNVLFSFYAPNEGHPIQTVERGLRNLLTEAHKNGTELCIKGSCSTGYGEDLIKAAYQLDGGIVETIAHYLAAVRIDPKVSFILDIGGQDMKAMFVSDGVIDRIEINEACSSGCGTFIETFAKSLGHTAAEFAALACQSTMPCDLGTRCTVFMNSKVKQSLREGATEADIAAGLAYSVVKNCLYKVLKLTDSSQLGKNIVVQGGTMRGDAVVRALELLTGATVSRSNMPELMGAYGCALYAKEHSGRTEASLEQMLQKAIYTQKLLNCHGCDNQCTVTRYRFSSGNSYYAGNRCERVFSNGEGKLHGQNIYKQKNQLLFARHTEKTGMPLFTIGLPRCLNMYENYPFWHTLFTECGIQVSLSDASDYADYERSARMVMSDNICFPAKLVHSHIQNLIEKHVDRIFMPFVVYEHKGKEQNSFNCPIVTGYSEVIKSVQADHVPIDAPAISFKDPAALLKQCKEYLYQFGINRKTIEKAFHKAEEAQADFEKQLIVANRRILSEARVNHRMVVMLAGRPYHTDPLIQHKIADTVCSMGVDVINEDLLRCSDDDASDANFLAQWAYPNRILKAARWCAMQDDDVQFVELTSFGCGPDAFLQDEVRAALMRHGKSLTLIKLDDINNVGSMRLRLRSLIESLKLKSSAKLALKHNTSAPATTPIYDKQQRHKKILAPFFTPFISPLIPSIMHAAGYDMENLPPSDAESAEWGLKYANNEVCYPATLIVGDIIKAFKSGQYDPDETVVAMTQTGGQCRASNYISLIKKALIEAGYTNTPVFSLTFGGEIKNLQPAFKVNWMHMLPIILRAVVYSDCMAKLYYATAAREKQAGLADSLLHKWLAEASYQISSGQANHLFDSLAVAAREFQVACRDTECPRVGIVGEIFLKFNPFANKNIASWFTSRGIEVIPSMLTDFFMQSFVNTKAWNDSHVEKRNAPEIVYRLCLRIISREIKRANQICSSFSHFLPFRDIFAQADDAQQAITLNAQFGEGWLLPAEIFTLSRHGVNNVVSLQPFGCIANHICSKGIEKRLKTLLPQLNLLSLDFDSSVSDVNINNRLLLFLDSFKDVAGVDPNLKIS